MKKPFTLLIATAIAALLCFSLVSCGECEHTYGEWITDRTATESAVGERHRECTKCGDKIIEEIPNLTHTHTYAEAWSYDDSYHWHDSTCGHDPIGKAAHTYGEWIVDREATEDAAGAKHRVCTVCNKIENAEIEKLPHTHKYTSAWSYDGTYHWHASTCGHTDAVSDKEKHDFGGSGICMCGAKDESISVKVYIDGKLTDTLHTGLAYGFRITPPEKPEDITTNPNSEKYFYAWFTDPNFQTPLLDSTEFRADSAIYAKWVTIYTNDFRYTVSEGKATIVSLSVASTATTTLVIPAYINGFPVTTIGTNAFANNTFIRTLILCDGIQSIGVDAFSGCNSMTHVELPKSLTTISENAFQGCTTLPDISIPNSVTTIGSSAFYGCTGLTSITIPNSVTTIGSSAFYGCTGLTSVTIPNSVTSIGNDAFYGCSGLTSITIPNSVTTIGSSAFSGCSGLTNITIPNSVTSIGAHAFSRCTGLSSITIPDSVTSIGTCAFSGCSSLESMTLPFVGGSRKSASDTYQYPFGYIFGESSYTGGVATKSLTNSTYYIPKSLKSVTITGGDILRGAFYGCSGLTSITILDSVTSIDIYAFSGCTGLSSITIPNSVTSISNLAFSGCTGLTNITIPNSVTSIGHSAFYGCTGLSSIIVESGNSKYRAAGNCLIETESKTLVFGCKNSVIPSDDSVTSIGDYAFYDCTGLSSITIPKSVTSIGRDAFYGCTGLSSITIPNSVTSIGDRAFLGCTGLSSVTIPNSVTSIGGGAFYLCTGLTSVTIPDSVKIIGDSAFSGCTGLTSITIPNSITNIAEGAFSGCNSLESMSLPFVGGSRKSASDTYQYPFGYIFGESSYADGVATKQWYYGSSTSSSTYSTYYIPSSLKSVTITGGDILWGAFYGCIGLSSIAIPNSVTSIGGSAFRGCTGLTSITIPNSVTSIGDRAFSRCTGLSSITIPNSVTSIGDRAFYGCTGLTSITIPNSVTYIGEWAFADCGTFEILFEGTQEEWEKIIKSYDWMKNSSYTVTYLK